EKVVRADARRRVGVGAAVDGAVLAEDVAVADFQVGRLAFVLEILGLPADGGEGEEFVVPADAAGTADDDVGMERAAVADLRSGRDDAVGADADVRAEFRFGRDDGRRVDHGRNDERAPGGWRMFFALRRAAYGPDPAQGA